MAAWKSTVSGSSWVRRAVEHRGQVGAAAEPLPAGHHHARVHVDRRHMRIVHVGDERDAARPEARVLLGAGNVLAELGRELAVDGGDVDADLLEDAAVHLRHDAAAAVGAAMVGALPRRPARSGRRAGRQAGRVAGSSSSIASKAAVIRSRSSANQAAARAFFSSMSIGTRLEVSPARHTSRPRGRLPCDAFSMLPGLR